MKSKSFSLMILACLIHHVWRMVICPDHGILAVDRRIWLLEICSLLAIWGRGSSFPWICRFSDAYKWGWFQHFNGLLPKDVLCHSWITGINDYNKFLRIWNIRLLNITIHHHYLLQIFIIMISRHGIQTTPGSLKEWPC